jgi:hypothetical protein
MTDLQQLARRSLGAHAGLFGVAAVGVLLVGLIVPAAWWLFWALLAWGLLLGAHYLFVRSSSVDERWADRRASELVDKAYDFSHIASIRERYAGPAASRRRRERGAPGGRGERPQRREAEPK